MARQQKQTVDYFPHYADASERKTLTILQNKYGDTGYAAWFRLLELLASSDGHYITCSLDVDWEYLSGKLHVTYEQTTNILKTLVDLGAIDRPLWEKLNIIWSDNFMQNIAEVYRNRRRDLPSKPSCDGGNPNNLHVDYTQPTDNLHPQSRVEYTIVYNNIYSHWNDQKISRHKKLTEAMKRTIKITLRDYDEKDICQAITNYAFIVKQEGSNFTYKWTLSDFLKRGLEKFLDIEIAKSNYLRGNNAAHKGNHNPDGKLKGDSQKDATDPDKYTTGKYGHMVRR